MLEAKITVVYGGGGSIGGAVATAFARGRTRLPHHRHARSVAADMRSAGGLAQIDALDAFAVDAHADAVVAEAGSLDISFYLISHSDVQETPHAEMSPEDFARPVETAIRTMLGGPTSKRGNPPLTGTSQIRPKTPDKRYVYYASRSTSSTYTTSGAS